MKHISELKGEYYELEVNWKGSKNFDKLDRKRTIEKVFSKLGIPLKDWE